MPSKFGATGAAEANPDVLVLINLIRTATEFKADMKEMAKICKISHEKNVPRKISAVVAPHGFKFERGRIVEQDGSATDKNQGQNGAKVETSMKPTKKRAKRPNPNKKRKFEEQKEESESEDANIAKDESESAVEEGDGPEEGGASDEDDVKPEVE